MPFDATPLPTLDPSVRDLPPRERLERLRDWLANGGPGMAHWDYGQVMSDCGTVGCAGGWYFILVRGETDAEKVQEAFYYGHLEFGLTVAQYDECFVYTGDHLDKAMRSVTPEDVATVIDMVIDGKIK